MSADTVSVVIPTFNASRALRECLDALTWADAVIVVDMYSTDETPDICRAYPNVRFFQRRGYIYENVNFGFDQAETDWVIRLDSDEIIQPDLRDAILHVLRNPEPRISGYYFRGVHFMFGQPMRHGPYLDEFCWRKHMFRRGTARYQCHSEHEDITATGELRRLDGHYLHLTNPTVSELIAKMNYYTDRDAERYTDEEIYAPSRVKVLWRAVKLFLLYYVKYRGYRDGHAGFYCAVFRGALYQSLEAAKRWERWKASRTT
ncbi:MAG: glycosyltransferase family 2 protein [Chthonomonadales bacterium]|nr:glycosyltransferase family 2 protein [Chthonomonadales bacterium]